MSDSDLTTIRDALDMLYIRLTSTRPILTDAEIEAYEKAISILNRPKTETEVNDALEIEILRAQLDECHKFRDSAIRAMAPNNV